MTTMLEKVAAAIDRCWHEVDAESEPSSEAIARAALLAIREQDDEDIYRVAQEVGAIGAEAADFWPALIDDILNEKPDGMAERTMRRPDIDQISRFPEGKPK